MVSKGKIYIAPHNFCFAEKEYMPKMIITCAGYSAMRRNKITSNNIVVRRDKMADFCAIQAKIDCKNRAPLSMPSSSMLWAIPFETSPVTEKPYSFSFSIA